ncbi:hypothetical protein GS462_11080 [Rhodococcus hoagii]|nr:hypothetical protein [Prescottella equi]MBM4650955.1 hypothetical protein [Prescottella equi]MBM4686698.1 hypothetical protein [Prescottella equi]
MSRHFDAGAVRNAIEYRCAHPMSGDDEMGQCSRCRDILDDVLRITVARDAYGRPLRYREEASETNIWVRWTLGMAWWIGTTFVYGHIAEALVKTWEWEDPSLFVIGGIVYAIVTFGLVVYGIQAREHAHEWEVEQL